MSASAESTIRLFVFPIEEAVLFPTATLPLNVFEARYQQMVAESEKTGIPIAIAFEDPLSAIDPAHLDLVVGYGQPASMVRRPDGTQFVLLKGIGRARLKSIESSDPFLICQAVTLDEVADVTPGRRFLLHRFRTLLNKWLDENVKDDRQRKAIIANLVSPQAVLECLATCMVPDPDIRQKILEIDTADERVDFLQRVFS